ncbi:putative 3-demethylubiquinone-9 3-methyltransferase [Rhizodiscina lignyota]|uniref:3-demethylubiquinone-9 3-methyltransferase n=1 Tax=Rhizodiscina lignyota TaxID=1504668 RepID=A0A9P4IAQ4_9PEZI|nr:putative 3-demethylubiquinone-9 3-methyltransferase [Rhizodiscina lignyota]
MSVSKITPCLWFDGQAQEAAEYYTSIFPNSKITKVQHYTDAGHEAHHQRAGAVLIVAFELNGQSFTALNGGPQFKFSAAVSFHVDCKDQDEVDYYWDKLGEGGDEAKRQCGWLADKFGLSWQIVPTALKEIMADKDVEKVKKVTEAMMKMRKLEIAELKRALEG